MCPERALALAVAAALAGAPRTAGAQACCSGATALTPGRLALHERALVGTELRVARVIGSHAADASFRAPARGSAESDGELDLFASAALSSRLQLSALLPFAASARRTRTTRSEVGGGAGDMNFGLRFDVLRNRELRAWPGVAALAGVTLPTGKPPEAAEHTLGSDATGTGAAAVVFGLALERSFGPWLATASALVNERLPRNVLGVKSRLAPELVLGLGAAYAVSEELVLAGAVTSSLEGEASVDGESVRDTSKRRTRAMLTLGWAPADTARLRAGVFSDLPLSGLGENEPAATGLSVNLVRSFL